MLGPPGQLFFSQALCTPTRGKSAMRFLALHPAQVNIKLMFMEQQLQRAMAVMVSAAEKSRLVAQRPDVLPLQQQQVICAWGSPAYSLERCADGGRLFRHNVQPTQFQYTNYVTYGHRHICG